MIELGNLLNFRPAHNKYMKQNGKVSREERRGEESRGEDFAYTLYIFMRTNFQISLNFHFLQVHFVQPK